MSTSSTSDDETISNSAEEGSGDSYDEFGEDFEAGIEPYVISSSRNGLLERKT